MIRLPVSGRFRLLLATLLFALVGVVASFITAQPVAAAGEVYTWSGENIQVTGGALTKPLLLTKQTGTTADQLGRYGGGSTANDGRGECILSMTLFTYKATGTGTGKLMVILGGSSASNLRICDDSFLQTYNGATVSIAGSPGGTGAETPEQRLVRVTIYASEPMSKAPKEVTITLKKGDGTTVGSQTVPAKDQVSSSSTLPPEQRAVSYNAIFQNIDPGDYQVCDTYTNKCQPVKHKDAGKVLDFTYGTKFQADYTKEVRVHVNVHGSRPCGSTITINPMEVIVTGADGKEYKLQTTSGVGHPQPEEEGRSCTAQYSVGLDAVFKDMSAMHYEACATGADCVGGDKKDGEPLELELNVITEQQAPPDQPICITGDGIAGALAWIACPAVEIIAKATDIFEKSIIIPFMTISPLTTSNTNAIYVLWQNLRDIANVGFIVLAIYSVISISVSKYNLKRILPRMLLVVIGINLSYFVVAFIVDAFNIFGAGVSQLLMSALQQAGTAMPVNGTKSSPASAFALGGAALLAVIVTAGGAIGWLFGVIGIAFIFILVLILVLVLRQIAIVMLVILAPLAILAYLLPNTESMFTRWRRNLVQLLMMYPLMVLLFAAGKILGVLIMQPDFKIGVVPGFAAVFDIPYHFLAQATGGVTDQVVQGVKVILWFCANALVPAAGIPILAASSGMVMDKTFGFFNRRVLQPRYKRSKDELSTLSSEARARLAKSKYSRFVPGLQTLAGAKMRREAKLNARVSNLQHEQEQYAADRMSRSKLMRFQAGGVAGSAGRTRAAASAAGVAAKNTKQDIDNEMALLHDKMRELAMDEETLTEKIARYLENPTAQNAVIEGSNGKVFDLATEGKDFQRALLNSAAAQGHVSAIEAARLNTDIDQKLVDDIIRRNEGALKSHGGNHLVTQFNMAAGRDFSMKTAADRNRARVAMHAARLSTMANSGQNSIAGMKYGLLTGTAEMLHEPGFIGTGPQIQAQRDHRRDVLAALSPEDRVHLREKLDEILDPRNASTLARADVDPEVFKQIRDNM